MGALAQNSRLMMFWAAYLLKSLTPSMRSRSAASEAERGTIERLWVDYKRKGKRSAVMCGAVGAAVQGRYHRLAMAISRWCGDAAELK